MAGPWEMFGAPTPKPWEQFQGDSFKDRFGAAPPDNPALKSALEQRAAAMTQGPAVSPMASMDIEHTNVVPAASQGTSPNIHQYGGKLVSNQTFQNDAGEILYRDPATGEVVPTNTKTQVALRDPTDNTVKIFSRSADTNENPAVGIARTLAPGLASGAPTARPAVAIGQNVNPAVRASDVFAAAKPAYREFDRLAPQAAQAGTADTLERISAALEKGKQPSTFAGPKAVRDTVATLGNEGDFVTIDKLRNMRETLGDSLKSGDNRERAAATIARSELLNIIKEASPEAGAALEQANAGHAAAHSLQDIQRLQNIAGIRTARAGYGGNAINNMKQELSKILVANENGKFTGLKSDEIAAINDIVSGDTKDKVLRNVGAMSPSKGIMAILGGIGTGGTTMAVGAAANKLGTVMTADKIEKLKTLIAKRSPDYEKAVSLAAQRWEKAQQEVSVEPTSNKIAAFINASRTLSNGLTRDGIQVSTGDLIRALQGPAKSAAEPDQQPVPGNPPQ